MSVQASAINEFNGQLSFTEVRAATLEAAQARAEKVAKAFASSGKQVVGIAYDLGDTRRVRLASGEEMDYADFLATKGLKDEGYAVEPSEVHS
jgi:uncharacterized protein YggE